jgi:hypothetical protein
MSDADDQRTPNHARNNAPVTLSVSDINSLCDRLEARSSTFLLRNEPEQARDLVLASRLCRHFLKVGWIKTSIGLTD